MSFKRITQLSLLFLVLIILPHSSCKKNSTTPDVNALTRPVIWLNQFEYSFSASEVGSNPSGKILQVKNTGPDTLDYTISDNADWLSVEPGGGASTGQVIEHTIVVDKTGLKAQNEKYSATITITCSQAYNNPQEIRTDLNLTKEPPPEIWVNTQALTFSAQEGGSNPPSQTLIIRNSGQGTLKYEISDNVSWLRVNPTSGTSEGGNKNHTVSVDINGLSEGTYSGIITISDPEATNSPQHVDVSLTVSKEALPTIWISRTQITFATTAGQNPSSQNIRIRNNGGGTLQYQLTSDSPWLTANPNSGDSQGEENTHIVSVDISGLSQGTYYGTITISDSNATNSPQTVNVTLEIGSIPTDNEISISCSPSSGGTGTTVALTISIKGNLQEILAFGLELNYDQNMFSYQNYSRGALTGNWVLLEANPSSPGRIIIGGAVLGGTPITVGSTGSLIIVRLRVTGSGYSSGTQSQISISNFADDIVGMTPTPGSRTFTYN